MMSPPLDRAAQSTKRAERTEETRQRIIEASIELFMEQGYDRTTTRQILQRVGILNGSLYNIYKSKEDIFSDIVVTVMRDTLRWADARLPPDSPLCLRLCFPMCIQVYASNRSERIAELLVMAHKRKGIRKKIMEMFQSWTQLDDDEQIIRLELCGSAVGGLVERIYEEPETVDEEKSMRIIVEMVSKMMDLPCPDANRMVDTLICAFRDGDMVICGVRI